METENECVSLGLAKILLDEDNVSKVSPNPNQENSIQTYVSSVLGESIYD